MELARVEEVEQSIHAQGIQRKKILRIGMHVIMGNRKLAYEGAGRKHG